MASKETFTKGMAALAMNFNREITAELIELYWAILQDLEDLDLDRAFRLVLAQDEFFPPTARILKYAQTRRLPAADAGEVFTKIVSDYASGEALLPVEVQHRYGRAARLSFQAAGGVMAFNHCGTEDTAKWVRKPFVEAWKEVVEADPIAALPGPADQITDGEILSKVQDLVAKKMP